MEGVRKRDATAFEALYDGFHRLVYGVALRMLNDVGAAEDVTQTVFLKLWSSPHLFRSGNFAAWIVRVTRNRCLDIIRSKAFTSESLTESGAAGNDNPSAAWTTQETTGAPDEIALAHLEASRVRAALAQLPDDQRKPIEMGFFEGVTHEEMARRTGVPLGTIKTRIRAGLHKLRATLDGAVTV